MAYLKDGRYSDKIDGVDLEKAAAVIEFEDILSKIPVEFYLEMFGDHVEVTVNRDGSIVIEDYDHD